MRIAVIADTHDRYPSGLPGLLKGADEIWHLGDVCDPETLVEFELLGKPMHVVRGNNDSHPWPMEMTLVRGSLSFHLVHIPPRRAPAGVHFLLHGHTHVPRDDIDFSRVRWLNPGCISYPRSDTCSFAWLTLERNALKRWEVITL
ncbi:MAG: metallophosphoesterase family protein [Opitutaceae bacterium]|nr:metallophosphoesterase family protein [Opitutaceae bacterium]